MPDDTRSKLGQNFHVLHHASLHRRVRLYSCCFCNSLQAISGVV